MAKQQERHLLGYPIICRSILIFQKDSAEGPLILAGEGYHTGRDCTVQSHDGPGGEPVKETAGHLWSTFHLSQGPCVYKGQICKDQIKMSANIQSLEVDLKYNRPQFVFITLWRRSAVLLLVCVKCTLFPLHVFWESDKQVTAVWQGTVVIT